MRTPTSRAARATAAPRRHRACRPAPACSGPSGWRRRAAPNARTMSPRRDRGPCPAPRRGRAASFRAAGRRRPAWRCERCARGRVRWTAPAAPDWRPLAGPASRSIERTRPPSSAMRTLDWASACPDRPAAMRSRGTPAFPGRHRRRCRGSSSASPAAAGQSPVRLRAAPKRQSPESDCGESVHGGRRPRLVEGTDGTKPSAGRRFPVYRFTGPALPSRQRSLHGPAFPIAWITCSAKV